MIKKTSRETLRRKRHARLRLRLAGTADRPRLSVFRSSRFIYAQVIDDASGRTLAAASSRERNRDHMFWARESKGPQVCFVGNIRFTGNGKKRLHGFRDDRLIGDRKMDLANGVITEGVRPKGFPTDKIAVLYNEESAAAGKPRGVVNQRLEDLSLRPLGTDVVYRVSNV